MFRSNPRDKEHFQKVFDRSNLNTNGVIFQFGVASGNTLEAILDVMIQRNIPPTKVFGFDAFQGLPKESEGVSIHDEWQESAFNVKDELNTHHDFNIGTIEEGIQKVAERFTKYNLDIYLIKEWYANLSKLHVYDYQIEAPIFIDIDVDLYISTIQLWDFLLSNNLLKNGCIVRYDDWENENIGEGKAHIEIAKKYQLKFSEITEVDGKMVLRYIS